ncbi:glycosyltransferase family A protein [Tabrizicola aquatica]|uniref:glycosyltransferase family A protein n=1 Tax=Tabrizicola aquatica TaxID=909926 RepID=UPI000CD04D82|nr:glycosyltransferase family A protein [Tabrizicola aquatica]
MRHVISLSTVPPRFHQIGPTLRSLVRQTSRPEAVELYIPRSYRRFPEWGGGLPDVPEGVTIVRVDEDLGPATKILPAAKAWRGQAVELIYVDDDRGFARDWVRRCLDVRKSRPDDAICGAGFSISNHYGFPEFSRPRPLAVPVTDPSQQIGYHLRMLRNVILRKMGLAPRRKAPWQRFEQSGFVDIGEGFGGVMVRPEYFDDAAFVIPPILWTVDDIWLSGTLARRGIRIWADKDLYVTYEHLDSSFNNALFQAVIEGADREQADRACIDHMRATYGIWGGVADQRT